ncbi:hypothetical protein VC83_07136 [Pseudogymnoascus destructans]|uniref:Uncharacterized protein n=1 Tax=Pseudogymnoascus destructans TaxID=655981 RepID=A0A177A6M2_9PEZI|nr:uncharacterized protein VC83_07136 [Pseudogymnoascus destructans]OAF56664.1 hypothetical protein VC83_07136 [Pseudogymnoascus destructans]
MQLDVGLQWLSAVHKVPPELNSIWIRWRKLYHKNIQDGVIRAGARRWGSGIWKTLWESGATKFGDIWDPDVDSPITPHSLTPQKASEARRAIERLVDKMPPSRKAVLHSRAFSLYDPSDPPREEFFIAYNKK